ncbi:MAG: A/G-specific adenine glycosylase, partial [Firmicutes bacterium]|nr:A/G-specific adenine glycosylase [Bacillota bacterium]
MDIKKLESWYLVNQRILPFRATKNPYRIWVSEIMLQQTQVDTALPFYKRFLEKYPTIKALAKASDDELHKMVEGIGYYRRFANMLLAARQIVELYDGVFPNTYEEVLKLPGIGKYTAGAIMSIAFNQSYSALDGNVIRVLSRYLGVHGDMKEDKNRKKLDAINQSYLEKATPEVYTQAMMELGAMVCKVQNPLCESCPLHATCFAYKNHQIENFPEMSKSKAKKEIHFITLILKNDDRYYVRKKEENLLKGMYLYPQFELEDIEHVIEYFKSLGVHIKVDGKPKDYKHVFTHLTWHMSVYHAHVISGELKDYQLVDAEELQKIPMAIAHR